MIVYRTPTRIVNTAELARIRDPLRLLIEFGEVEAALLDERFPERDGLMPRLRIKDIPQREITVPVAEGYAYYALFPHTYSASARRFWEELSPPEVVVIGLRGIGTSLSRVVQSALEERGVRVHSFTVRPRGHPFDRELRITSELAARWRALGHAFFAIVDEGPGLSGSSFCCTARKLSELGIPDERIVFFPSWQGRADTFRSEDARRRWSRHRKYTTESAPSPDEVDLSAGRWRELVYADESEYPDIFPQHEARKYLAGGVLRKFVGLGPYGEAKFERAKQLGHAGLSPKPLRLDNGFIEFGWHLRTAGLRPSVADLLAFRYKNFQTGAATDPQPLAQMIEINTGITGLDLPEAAPAVIVDGRLQPHEWIGSLKTDALDHGDNHFLPGPTDIAWDLAGAEIELGLDVTAQYARLSGDRGIAARLPFYKIAYAAFRLGYTKMFGLNSARYEAALEREACTFA